jgi:hypothetical protein
VLEHMHIIPTSRGRISGDKIFFSRCIARGWRECNEERSSEDALPAPFFRVIEPKKMGAHSGRVARPAPTV